MNKGKISASMMCASLDKIFYYLDVFEKNQIEFLHIDIMDGDFVPNLALGTDYVKSLRNSTTIPFDFHFLVNNPLKKLTWFDVKENDQVAFHYENNNDINDCIRYIHSKGAKAFIALNPETDFKVLEPYYNDIDGILLMMVNPGFAGQKMLPFTINKVDQLKKYLLKNKLDNIQIEVDGNISIEKAKELYKLGAEIFVAGSSSIFKQDELDVEKVIKEKRKVIGFK